MYFELLSLKGSQDIVFHPWCPDGQADGQQEKVSRGCISETERCRKLIRGSDIGWECRCATSWCDLDLILDLAVVTLTYKILSGLFLRNHKV